ncbi:DUF5011 domain-containing protein [Paucihalobacter ruber]|uniref:DUF5011 domain-containing protein n=1 Tax=Paucihalobacter ruber TaxID=2567861 RepID=A0A506PFB5_9FLAO|nr:immunoglobulin-like domain-containing protein [Paucihalobacter ruber]TPV32254.1 DUF5011 domain-containing protein [Paucihalobacter ruber]
MKAQYKYLIGIMSIVMLSLSIYIIWSRNACENDVTPPIILLPAPNLLLPTDIGECTASITEGVLSVPTGGDFCGVASVTPSVSPVGNPPRFVFPVGETIVTWTVTDASGNFTTSTQSVTVFDNEEPQITCTSDITVQTIPGECNALVNVPIPNATDNCSIISVVNDYNSGGADATDRYPIGTTVVTYTVTDSAGFTASCSINIIVENSQIPVITLIDSDTIVLEACDEYIEYGATAVDSCLGNLTSDIIIDNSAVNTGAVGTYQVSYNVSNSLGVAANTVFRTINVVDTTAPTLTLVGPSVLNIGACSTYTELGAIAIDPCFGNVSSAVVVDNASIDTNTIGEYTVTYNLMDASNNVAAQITRIVNVTITSPPEITILGDNPQIIEACSPYIELDAIAIEPCFGTDLTSGLVIDISNVDTSTIGTYIVSYNITDNDGNEAIEMTRVVEVVDSTAPEITLIGDNPQIIEACTPYIELGATTTDCSAHTLEIDTAAIDLGTEGTYTAIYTTCDDYGNCSTISREVQVVISNPTANAGDDFTNNICTETTINLAANSVIGTNASGLWTVTSGQTTDFSFSDPTSPTSTFTGDVGETYILTWTITDPCRSISDSITVTFINCSALDFDGVDDNITFRNNYNLTNNFSLELWVKPEAQNNSIQTILSKREVNNLVDGYDLRLVDNYISFNWNNAQALSSPYRMNTNQWHHVTVTFQNNTYRLYIDGVLINSTTGALPIENTSDFIVGAMHNSVNPPFRPRNYFDGGMDEFRIWNVALSENQIRTMMNQEIENSGGMIICSEVPLDIDGLTWNELRGYYRMNQNSDLFGGNLVPTNANGINGLLRFMTTLQPETAPLPYISNNNGNWTDNNTWLHGNVQAAPNSIGIDNTTPIDWNIVRTSHNISSGNNNLTVLGLLVDDNTLVIENSNPSDGQSLRVTNYLKLNGILKLVGESQLLQDINSIVDYSGTGSLHRDQQGTSNLFNYNYWSSPVSADGFNYTIGNVLHDGLQPVLWTGAVDANPNTTPITLSNRWLYLYENYPINSYADWRAINQTDDVAVGLGFLMKGSGSTSPQQNYTFIGQPNNGYITSPITANYSALLGNPYPSAIDAHEFILDNSSSMLGTLYFWEHFETNNTHILRDYQGGYAAYTLTGGTPAVSPPDISNLGVPAKIPERHIAVAQGFLVQANDVGGTLIFENDQRVFVKEAVTGEVDNGSIFMRSTNQNSENSNENLIKRIRLKFTAPDGAARHLLLGFVPNNQADDGVNYGYDALNSETLPNDISWNINYQNYIIQGVGDFDDSKMYPVNIFLETAGLVELELTALENFEEPVDVYLYDALTNTSHRINGINFTDNLMANNYIDRFYITFKPTNTLTVKDFTENNISIKYLLNSNQIMISYPNGIEITTIELINLLGQNVQTWNTNQMEQPSNTILIPVENISEGIYIVNAHSQNIKISSKKIVVQY